MLCRSISATVQPYGVAMKPQLFTPICLSLALLAAGPAFGQDAADPAAGAAQEAPGDLDILVTGDRLKQEAAIRSLTAEITRPPRIDKPLPRFYQPFCLKVIGFKPDYAAIVVERITGNASELGVSVGGRDCTPNALLIFTDDAGKAVKTLHKQEPWLFADLFEHQIERALAGSGAAYAWQTTETRGVDGKPFRIVEYDCLGRCPKIEMELNEQYQTGRLNQPIRMDVRGAVVLIDNAHLPGKTLDQLADYATMRLLASIDDVSADEAVAVPTILSLFTAPDSAPPDLSRFDRSYLRALYSLRPNAAPLSLRDATVRTWFREAEE